MLAQLERLHSELLTAISAMQRLAAGPVPERALLADARLKISRASQSRSRFVELDVYPALLQRLSGGDAEPVWRLRAEGIAMRALSTAHVARWTIESAISNWEEYRAASMAMTASMRSRIAAEKATLYRLLLDEDSCEVAAAPKLAARG